MTARKNRNIILELYYDSTVEPFENPRFDFAEVIKLLRLAMTSGITVRIVDTAGWDRELLIEYYKQIVGKRRGYGDIFGTRKKKGWFFGREVPALVVLYERGQPELYPSRKGDSIITISDFLQKLLSIR